MSGILLDLYSEPFSPNGGMFAGAAKRALGRPRLDTGTVLVREAVQNSWDARLGGSERIGFSISGWMMEKGQRDALRDYVFPSVPDQGLLLRESLQRPAIPVLVVRDVGCRGLGGPIAADVPTDDRTDFADFFMNLGRSPGKTQGGGTYGYGKSSLYVSSRSSTIVGYTRALVAGRRESRLMGAALGGDFVGEHDGMQTRFTGRHWWGRKRSDRRAIEPATGSMADILAETLGFTKYGAEETGTALLIVDFDTGERSLEEAVERMAHDMVWQCWPRLRLGGQPGPGISFSAWYDHTEVHVPAPESIPALRPFVRALAAIDGAASDDVEKLPVRDERSGRTFGTLAMTRYLQAEGEAEDGARPFALPAHHVALLREPRQVVRYLEVGAAPQAPVGSVGVFLASGEFEHVFRESEPPTHDDWVVSSLDSRQMRGIVKRALDGVRSAMAEFIKPSETVEEPQSGSPLAPLADRLSRLLYSLPGQGGGVALGGFPPGGGAGVSSGGGAASGGHGGVPRAAGTPRARLALHGPITLEVDEGKPVAVQRFSVAAASKTTYSVVTARTAVLTQDGNSSETDAPLGAAAPVLLGWRSEDGRERVSASDLRVDADDASEWSVRVALPADAQVAIELAAERGP